MLWLIIFGMAAVAGILIGLAPRVGRFAARFRMAGLILAIAAILAVVVFGGKSSKHGDTPHAPASSTRATSSAPAKPSAKKSGGKTGPKAKPRTRHSTAPPK